MKLKEENKILKDLVLHFNAYVPHICGNCKHYNCFEKYCSLHDRNATDKDGCSMFEMDIYDKARKVGVPL